MKALARELAWVVAAVLVAAACAWCYFGGAWPEPEERFVEPYVVEIVDPWRTMMHVASSLVLARYVVLGVYGWLRARWAAPPPELPWLFTWIGCVVTLLTFVAMALVPLQLVQSWVRPLFPVVDLLQPLPGFGEQSRKIHELVMLLAVLVQWPLFGALIDLGCRSRRRAVAEPAHR